jgi:excisionase family DNA binding protein
MKTIQLISVTPEQLQNAIIDGVKKQLDDLKKHFQPKSPNEYLTRQQVAKLLHVDLSTIHNLSVKGTLQKHQIGGRVLYRRSEIENSIVKLKNK